MSPRLLLWAAVDPPPPERLEPVLLTTREVSILLRVSTSLVKKFAANPDEMLGVHRVKVGSAWRFKRVDLMTWLGYDTPNGNGDR